MHIFLDLVLILNFLVDFLLLLAANRLAGYPAEYGKPALAAALGCGYAAWCLIPGFDFLGNAFWRLVVLALMAGLAFGWNRNAVQRGTVFVLLSMALGGIAAGFGGGSFGMLIVSALGLWLLCRVGLHDGVGQREFVPVELEWSGRKVRLTALRDTGNQLRDPLTGEQVLVAGADVAEELLGVKASQISHPVELLSAGTVPGLRLIPYHAVGQSGSLLPAVRFRRVKIGNTYADPLVAFAPEVLARSGAYQMLTGGAV